MPAFDYNAPEKGHDGFLPPPPATPDAVPSWNEFTQSTTIHGVKYIFDPRSHSLIRRYSFWLRIAIPEADARFRIGVGTNLQGDLANPIFDKKIPTNPTKLKTFWICVGTNEVIGTSVLDLQWCQPWVLKYGS